MHIYRDVCNIMLLIYKHINKCENISNHNNKNNIIEFIIKKKLIFPLQDEYRILLAKDG